MNNDCLFCKIASGEMDTKFVYQNDNLVAFKDINPKAPVHILIVPKKHIPTINDLEITDTPLVGNMIQTAKLIAKEQGIAEEGYRLVFNVGEKGGQEVKHIHLHLMGGRQMKWPAG